MWIVLTTAMLALTAGPALPAATGDAVDETAAATNLLTAERRAREATERLRLPGGRPARWLPGGEGWTPAWRPERPLPRDAPR